MIFQISVVNINIVLLLLHCCEFVVRVAVLVAVCTAILTIDATVGSKIPALARRPRGWHSVDGRLKISCDRWDRVKVSCNYPSNFSDN